MKAFLIGVLVIIVAAVAGYFYLKGYKPSGTTTSYQTASITRTGIVEKAQGADYHYVIMSNGQSWGAASQSVNLDQYVGKKVEATGQNSGTTLYIDTIKVIQ